MSNQVITVDGEERIVREDTAKRYRGVRWAFLSLAAFILIAAMMFLYSVITTTVTDPKPAEPVPAERHTGP